MEKRSAHSREEEKISRGQSRPKEIWEKIIWPWTKYEGYHTQGWNQEMGQATRKSQYAAPESKQSTQKAKEHRRAYVACYWTKD